MSPHRSWIRLHSYGSIWRALNDRGTILCARPMPDTAVQATEPRAPNSYICAKCYRILAGIDPAPVFLEMGEPSPLVALEERIAALEAGLAHRAAPHEEERRGNGNRTE